MLSVTGHTFYFEFTNYDGSKNKSSLFKSNLSEIVRIIKFEHIPPSISPKNTHKTIILAICKTSLFIDLKRKSIHRLEWNLLGLF